MKQVCIIGNKGNMGLRYKAILEHLQVMVCGIDEDQSMDDLNHDTIDGYIVATPTSSHVYCLGEILHFGKPILCEKPLCTSEILLNSLESEAKLITMVNQYKYLIQESDDGETFYNYFKTGKDGLAWDCLNIIGLAKKKPTIKNDSPVWQCTINGRELNLGQMDFAYVKMVRDWVVNPKSNWDYVLSAHAKVREEWLKY